MSIALIGRNKGGPRAARTPAAGHCWVKGSGVLKEALRKPRVDGTHGAKPSLDQAAAGRLSS